MVKAADEVIEGKLNDHFPFVSGRLAAAHKAT